MNKRIDTTVGHLPRITTAGQSTLVDQMARLAAEAVRAETEIEQRRDQRDAEQRQNYATTVRELTAQHEAETEGVSQEYTNLLANARGRYERDLGKLEVEQQRFVEQAKRQKEAALKAAKSNWERIRQNTELSHEVASKQAKHELDEHKESCDNHRYELQLVRDHVGIILKQRRCRSLVSVLEDDCDIGEVENADQQFAKAKARTLEKLQELDRQPMARYLDEGWIFLFFLCGMALSVVPLGLFYSWTGWVWIAASLFGGVVLAAVLTALIYRVVRRDVRQVVHAIFDAVTESEALLRRMRGEKKKECKRRRKVLGRQCEHDLCQADAEFKLVSHEIEAQYETRFEETIFQYQTRKNNIESEWEQTIGPYQREYPLRLEQMKANFQARAEQLTRNHQESLDAIESERQKSWRRLTERWQSGIEQFRNSVECMNQYCHQHFPDWPTINWGKWKHPIEPVAALRIGQTTLDLDRLKEGIPKDDRLHVNEKMYHLPTVLSFPECPSLLLKAEEEARDVAIETLQNTMLRLLTAMPPGKVRFTIIDPTGLGQNFSAFMHLADYDERLVASRIWTELSHINQRLMDLTQHMEDVIQKYLRNEFASIQQYNEHAGEVAEPFQILVVANFPANFSEESARRLVSIAASGARCGVYTLISCDMKMNLPRNFDFVDLAAHALTLEWNEGRFSVQDDTLSGCPLKLDVPPDDEVFTCAVRAVGQYAKDFNRVEVPFSFVAPAAGEVWKGDSRGGLKVALGRAGATKIQFLQLGEGTSQHVLIAGKTGSGKSTLLHTLITSTALHYGPHEVEFFLIDFKKGVEFKPYATFHLPQARVIAIESEREFGMSVLERLDRELQRRGDAFRDAGVQDVKGYRDAHPGERMPRALLIIDEFQEFFVKDDRIAQDAALLLDRLVRQGRAFGIHVLLGSQTLAGAYTLARSTLGQMAVRIALQCSEADSHLILSEENSAARLLNRPGEAIYNNANGLFEGNHPFQVVWLADHERENHLRGIATLAHEQQIVVDPPIVFEGNVAADPSENRLLRDLVEAPPSEQVNLALSAWLGAAVAIKDPTRAVFRRRGGSNLLMVGQREEQARGIVANCLVSLAAGMPHYSENGNKRPARFLLFDGARCQSSQGSSWSFMARQIGIDVSVVESGNVAETLAEVAAQLDCRTVEDSDTACPWFLFVCDLGRFRELRRDEDDFGFSRFDDNKQESPARLFARILQDGPPAGIHCLIWCDNYTTVNRWLDRQSLRDMESRVLFQMSASDSSNLMDSPAASRLGAYRAIFYSEERGEFEKFRPYAPPSDEWLRWVKSRFEIRVSGIRAPPPLLS